MAKKRKGNKKQKPKTQKASKLQKHNAEGYLGDLKHIHSLGLISDSKRDWIETTMLSLREKANCYEVTFAEYLLKKKITFIHQAPFIFSGKIYFADFYLPTKHAIVEIDGEYHQGFTQEKYDRFRDECFNGHLLKVIRIPNAMVNNEKDMEMLLKMEGLLK